jgi:hypothetical protein
VARGTRCVGQASAIRPDIDGASVPAGGPSLRGRRALFHGERPTSVPRGTLARASPSSLCEKPHVRRVITPLSYRLHARPPTLRAGTAAGPAMRVSLPEAVVAGRSAGRAPPLIRPVGIRRVPSATARHPGGLFHVERHLVQRSLCVGTRCRRRHIRYASLCSGCGRPRGPSSWWPSGPLAHGRHRATAGAVGCTTD